MLLFSAIYYPGTLNEASSYYFSLSAACALSTLELRVEHPLLVPFFMKTSDPAAASLLALPTA
jgi:hypothetical protein